MIINNTFRSTTVLLISILWLLSACSGGNNNKRTDSISVTSYNVGLALNFVPFTQERLVVNETLLADFDSDVICLQEVWAQEDVDALTQAMSENYPYIYTVEPEQVFSGEAACTSEEIAGLENCLNTQCPGLSGNDLVNCGLAQCSAFLNELSPSCFDGVVAGVGIPGITVDALVEAVTQPGGKFAFDGALGLILASKTPLFAREFQDFIEDSSANHRGALYAEVDVNKNPHVVGCTHPTANLGATIPYPESGKHGSWEGENRFMQEQMIAFANAKAGNNPIFFAGDFNCSIANASNDVEDDFADNCQLWLDDGFIDPAAEQLPCSWCEEENLVLQLAGGNNKWLYDHVFVKNLDSSNAIIAERVFDDPVSIEALVPPAELQPEDSPMMTHPSDHFGVELEINLR